MADFHSGKDGTAFVGANEMAVTGWSMNPTTEIQRFRNSLTNGATRKEVTFSDGTGTITVDHDFEDSPFEAPISIAVGSRLTDVKLYLRKSDGAAFDTEPYWDLPIILVTGTPQSLEVEGKIQTTFNFEVDGDFGYPGVPVGS